MTGGSGPARALGPAEQREQSVLPQVQIKGVFWVAWGRVDAEVSWGFFDFALG